MIKDARMENNLATPVFDNLRTGHWILDFLLKR